MRVPVVFPPKVSPRLRLRALTKRAYRGVEMYHRLGALTKRAYRGVGRRGFQPRFLNRHASNVRLPACGNVSHRLGALGKRAYRGVGRRGLKPRFLQQTCFQRAPTGAWECSFISTGLTSHEVWDYLPQRNSQSKRAFLQRRRARCYHTRSD